MPEVATYAPGTPMWVDFSATDPQKSRDFYTSLFGWTVTVGGPETMNYSMFFHDGKVVGGLGESQDPAGNNFWLQYVCAEDVNAVAKKVADAGGTVVMGPMDIMDQGSMLIFKDTTGAFCGVWQPNQMHGAAHVNQAGGWGWSELQTRDMAAAKKFYTAVFDWGIEDNEFEMGNVKSAYTQWKVGDRSVAGGMPMAPGVPAEVPSNWLIYWAVENCDAAVEKVKALGGQVMMPAFDSEQGRFAVVADNQGAAFAVIQLPS